MSELDDTALANHLDDMRQRTDNQALVDSLSAKVLAGQMGVYEAKRIIEEEELRWQEAAELGLVSPHAAFEECPICGGLDDEWHYCRETLT